MTTRFCQCSIAYRYVIGTASSWGALLLLAVISIPAYLCSAPLDVRAEGPESDKKISAIAAEVIGRAESRIGNEVVIGALVGDLNTGQVIYSKNQDKPMSPASVLKLITTFAVLKFLGSEFVFTTEVFVPVQRPETISGTAQGTDLYIKGGGDPSFRDEEAQMLAEQVAARGIREVRDLIIDASAFESPPSAQGSNPYQAALSATSIDHNSYRVTIAPAKGGAGRKSGIVSITNGAPFSVVNRTVTVPAGSAELSSDPLTVVQTPSSDSIQPTALSGSPKPFSTAQVALLIKGAIGAGSPAREFYQSAPDPPRFFAGVIKRRLELAGVRISGRLLIGTVPADASLLLSFSSSPLVSIINDLNHFSSNFIAGQLLYALGRGEDGFFRRDRGLVRLEQVLTDLGIPSDQFRLLDASGLDPGNQLSVGALHRVLFAASADFSISPDFFSSLGRFGHTGTVKKRRAGDVEPPKTANLFNTVDSVWAKTGTLDKVSSLAGVLETRGGRRLTFVVISNGRFDPSQAKSFEDDLVSRLVQR